MRWFGFILPVMILLLIGTRALLLSPVATAQTATPPAAAMTLRLVEHAVHLNAIDHGDPGPSVGDVQIWGPNPLYDAGDADALSQDDAPATL